MAAPRLIQAGLALSLLVAASCGGQETKEKTAPGSGGSRQAVTAATAAVTNLPRTVTASGNVSAWEEVPIGAETGGLVATGVFADEGAYVRQGQLLVKLNDTLLQAQLRQQEASVQAAEANAAREDAELSRARELRERGFLSQASLDQAIAEQRSTQAQLSSARAALAETRERLDQTNIRAPVAGMIISRGVTRGQIVQAGNELFRMVREGRLELDAQVPETQLPLIRSGQSASITSSEAGSTTGRVRIVTPEVDPQTRLGIARISLTPGSQLRPGMFARAEIAVGDQPETTVPTGAVLYRNNRAGVFVLNADNATVRFQPITVLSRTDEMTAVSGVQPGARVIVRGAGFLNDGDRVDVAAPARPAAQPARP